MAHGFKITALWRQREIDLWEFEASLVHTVRKLFLVHPRQRNSWKAREETSPPQLEEAVGEGEDSEG